MAKKKRKLIGKDRAQWIHVRKRCLQRTGIEMTKELSNQLVSKITTGHPEAEFIEKQSNRVTIWDIKHEIDGEDFVFRAVYDKMRKNIVTILNNADKGRLPVLNLPKITAIRKAAGKENAEDSNNE